MIKGTFASSGLASLQNLTIMTLLIPLGGSDLKRDPIQTNGHRFSRGSWPAPTAPLVVRSDSSRRQKRPQGSQNEILGATPRVGPTGAAEAETTAERTKREQPLCWDADVLEWEWAGSVGQFRGESFVQAPRCMPPFESLPT